MEGLDMRFVEIIRAPGLVGRARVRSKTMRCSPSIR